MSKKQQAKVRKVICTCRYCRNVVKPFTISSDKQTYIQVQVEQMFKWYDKARALPLRPGITSSQDQMMNGIRGIHALPTKKPKNVK